MIELSIESLAAIVALVILLGSLIGSTLIYLAGSEAPSRDAAANGGQFGWRPARANDPVQTYSYADAQRRSSRGTTFARVVFAAGLAMLGSTAGYASYTSPWPVETDMRHFAAFVHCDLAERVGLAPARSGEPGYHRRNDPDGNGVSCEGAAGAAMTPGTALTTATQTAPTVAPERLSAQRLSWPSAAKQTTQ